METVKKVKLLQNLPNVDKGAVLERISNTFYVMDNFGSSYYTSETVVLEKTDWFAPYIFTTEDNADIVEGDEYWAIDLKNNEVVWSIADCESLRSDWLKFKDKDKALLYLQSLKPKFKVGDIVQSKNGQMKPDIIVSLKENKYGYIWLKLKRGGEIEAGEIEMCTNEEILKYYEQQGWVKGAKFKHKETIYTFNYLYSNEKWDCEYLLVNYAENAGLLGLWLKDCELIKELKYPKSWEELNLISSESCFIPDDLFSNRVEKTEYVDKYHNDKNKFSNEKQAQSALAFAELSQLHKAMIDEYNKINNCNWKPDFGYNEKYYYIRRKYNNLHIAVSSCDYAPLTFPDKECVEFALKEWNSLWKQLYELN